MKGQKIAQVCLCVLYTHLIQWWAVSRLSLLLAQIQCRLIIPGDYVKQQGHIRRGEVHAPGRMHTLNLKVM